METIGQSKVNLALDKERKELARLRDENDLLRQRIEMFDQEKLTAQQREKQLQDKINNQVEQLKLYARNADMKDYEAQITRLSEESSKKESRITEHLQLVNTL